MKNKTFDCVQMKRTAQESIYQEIKAMNIEEQFQYWKKIEQDFRNIRLQKGITDITYQS